MAAEWIPTILKTPPVSEENDPADHEPSHKSSEPSWEGKDDSIDIDKDDFPSEQANGDTEEDADSKSPDFQSSSMKPPTGFPARAF